MAERIVRAGSAGVRLGINGAQNTSKQPRSQDFYREYFRTMGVQKSA
jgi:hypothetical protein